MIRSFILWAGAATACVALSACGPAPAPAPVAETGCERQAVRVVSFTAPDARDTITARALGDACATAVVVWTLQDGAGKVLWTHAAPYDAFAAAADPSSAPEMGAFLRTWTEVAVDDTAASPPWVEDGAPEAWGPSGHSMFARETYETIRAAQLPRVCVPTSRETETCLFYDAQAEAVDVHYERGA
ncbi:MAG: hypothetical protein NW200_12805 [Hyphomonadaceae bacterium]|nr:hypothetical protein [Hyphomonadaceae bacterium]